MKSASTGLNVSHSSIDDYNKLLFVHPTINRNHQYVHNRSRGTNIIELRHMFTMSRGGMCVGQLTALKNNENNLSSTLKKPNDNHYIQKDVAMTTLIDILHQLLMKP